MPTRKADREMTLTDPAGRVEELRATLNEANHRYHVLDAPTISDREYDLLFKELNELVHGRAAAFVSW